MPVRASPGRLLSLLRERETGQVKPGAPHVILWVRCEQEANRRECESNALSHTHTHGPGAADSSRALRLLEDEEWDKTKVTGCRLILQAW